MNRNLWKQKIIHYERTKKTELFKIAFDVNSSICKISCT